VVNQCIVWITILSYLYLLKLSFHHQHLRAISKGHSFSSVRFLSSSSQGRPLESITLCLAPSWSFSFTLVSLKMHHSVVDLPVLFVWYQKKIKNKSWPTAFQTKMKVCAISTSKVYHTLVCSSSLFLSFFLYHEIEYLFLLLLLFSLLLLRRSSHLTSPSAPLCHTEGLVWFYNLFLSFHLYCACFKFCASHFNENLLLVYSFLAKAISSLVSFE